MSDATNITDGIEVEAGMLFFDGERTIDILSVSSIAIEYRETQESGESTTNQAGVTAASFAEALVRGGYNPVSR